MKIYVKFTAFMSNINFKYFMHLKMTYLCMSIIMIIISEWRDNTGVKTFALYLVESDSIPDTALGPTSITNVHQACFNQETRIINPEYTRCQSHNKIIIIMINIIKLKYLKLKEAFCLPFSVLLLTVNQSKYI